MSEMRPRDFVGRNVRVRSDRGYSTRNAEIGSMRVARRAGT